MLTAFLLILVVGVVLRVPHLAERPMHHDEANQAYRFGILLEEGTYEYDADDHHGPTLYYLTLPAAWLGGADTFAETSEITYRMIPVIFGLLLIGAAALLRRGLGGRAIAAAALLTAMSPAMAYYSRFYIQEMLLVFFTFITVAAGWHAWDGASRGWAVVCGVSAGLMFATKETAVIAYAAFFGAAVLCVAATRRLHVPWKIILTAAGCAVLVSCVLYSSFFTHLRGPLDSILAFKGYLARGAGMATDHVHPWNFYLRMLTVYRFDGGPAWSEGLIFGLGLIGLILVLLKKAPVGCHPALARFLALYTVLLTVIYSGLAYKTPWCILSFLHGWILLAGIGTAGLVELAQRSRRPRLVSGIVLFLLFTAALGTLRLAHRTVYRYAADYRNPYVYAHTSPDFMNLVKRVAALEAVSPRGDSMYIQVAADPKAMWPLPFYLRGYPNTGYWTNVAQVPAEPRPDILITAPEHEADPDRYLSELYGLRADTLLALHIRRALWDAFIETRR